MKRLNWVPRNHLSKGDLITLLSLILIGIVSSSASAEIQPPVTETPPLVDLMEHEVSQGALRVKIADEVVECPLKHTDVKVDITGFIARATVTQTFSNPYDENIEAVYVFPLPHTAAVDAMTMKIGERTIVGVMKRRAVARAIYEQAVEQGKTASLLEQERPNIFTQSVGNIKPNQEIHIEISYVDVLNYDVGTYEFHFPMVVGPRYIPGHPISEEPLLPKELEGKVGEVKDHVTNVTLDPDPSGTGWSPDTTRVPDASRITPPVLKPGYRTGHDIRLSVSLDAGVPIQDLEVVNHAATLDRVDTSKATVEISPMDSIPNKDFVMKYKVVGEKPEMAVFAHATGPEQRYFMLMIQPKLDAELAEAPPRELVFLVDVSGSMSGEPMAKVKAAMRHFFQLSKPDDTFQVITFAREANSLFKGSVSVTEENIARALAFTQQLSGGGGTKMLAGIQAVLSAPVDPKRVRIVVLLTDGYIGNEEEIIAEVGRRTGDAIRFWTIGIGSSPNRFLLDGVAKQGGGMSGVLDLNTNPKDLVTQVVERIHRAQLANIQMDWKQLAVYETYPRRIPELWAGRPVILFGRYAAGGKTKIKLSGTAEGTPIAYTLDVTLPDAEPAKDVLAKVWARKKIEDLSAQAYDYGDTPEVEEEITRIALDYRLMSPYTSFVAVDESEISDLHQRLKPPRRVVVPVPLPEGVNFEGVFGDYEDSFRGRYTEFAIGDSRRFTRRRFLPKPVLKPTVPLNPKTGTMMAPSVTLRELQPNPRLQGSPANLVLDHPAPTEDSTDTETQALQLQASAKAAVAEAQALQQEGYLEAARVNYQHALGLMTGIQADEDTLSTTVAGIQTLSDAILKKRAEKYPGLSRKLNVVLRNQGLADAIRTLADAGGFQLDLVPGSLEDVKALLNLPECRVTYLDVRQATVGQGLEWLLAPYHLTWEMGSNETLRVSSAPRMSGLWGYDVSHIALSLTSTLDENASAEDAANALNAFLQTVRTVIGLTDDSKIKDRAAHLINPGILLVYGSTDTHGRVQRVLKALKDSDTDIAGLADLGVSEKTLEDVRALQKLTTVNWKAFAEAHKKAVKTKARQRIVANLDPASLQLLTEALQGTLDLEALTKLQVAWASPEFETVSEQNGDLAMRSAWCIRAAAQLVPTDVELMALSESVLSKIGPVKGLKRREAVFWYGPLYAVLAHQTGGTQSRADRSVFKALIGRASRYGYSARLIAESLFFPSDKSDKALHAAISEHRIYGDDALLLTCLIAKRRGGQVWQTFYQEFPDIARQSDLNGQIRVIINRLAASRKHI